MTAVIESRFEKFHRENPEVWKLFKRFAEDAISAGLRTLSANFLFERIRWETSVVTKGDNYKVNDHYRPYYARLWNRTHPASVAKFNTRKTMP